MRPPQGKKARNSLEKVEAINQQHRKKEATKDQIERKLKERERRMNELREKLRQKGVPEEELPKPPGTTGDTRPQKSPGNGHARGEERLRCVGEGKVDSSGKAILSDQRQSRIGRGRLDENGRVVLADHSTDPSSATGKRQKSEGNESVSPAKRMRSEGSSDAAEGTARAARPEGGRGSEPLRADGGYDMVQQALSIDPDED